MGRNKKTLIRRFHQARWDEEMIMEMSVPGERGILVPQSGKSIDEQIGDGVSSLPKFMQRRKRPELPEVNQMRVNRHFMRLSQETMGCDITTDITQGTCTMKYSPKVQEHTATRHPGVVDVHPLQDPSTMQGILEIFYKVEQFMKEISGLDYFSFQPSAGAQAVFTNACILRAYHEERGDRKRDEIVTTVFTHPSNAAAPHVAGYKIITLMPDENGLPDLEAFKSAVSERTAGIFITNPEDTGIYNSRIKTFTEIAHKAGALCVYDQANANSMLGIARAKEAGFDLCHFNLHKTFSSPHGGFGPGLGAIGVKDFLRKYLPVPRVEFDGEKYLLNYNCPESVGKIRFFCGNFPIILKTYMWIMQLGAEGLREVAITSVLNSQYMFKKITEMPGISMFYAEGKRRLEQVRYSWAQLKEDTGFGTHDIYRRFVDFGIQHYFPAHHPWLVPEPWTIEPCESYNLDDIEENLAIFRQIIKEAYEEPEKIENAPYNAPIHKMIHQEIDDPELIYLTWRQYKKKTGKGCEKRRWEKDVNWEEEKKS